MLISIPIILIAVTIHEFAHAWMADHLGDPTAKLEGRLTLNPLAHLDPLGTLTLIIAGFGWGKPVPIDPYNLRNPKRDQALIALSGPMSNIIFAILIALLLKIIPSSGQIALLFVRLLIINLGLAFFNLIPLYPLDGASVIVGFLPFEKGEALEAFLKRYSLPILIALFLPLFFGRSLLSIFLTPLIDTSLKLLIRLSL